MTFRNEISLSDIINVVTIIVAAIAIYFSNKNSRNQIQAGKLEELYEAVKILAFYYPTFKVLYFKVLILNNQSDQTIKTFDDYILIRDRHITEAERLKINNYLSRMEILAKCYADNSLQKEILAYYFMMYAFSDFITNAGSIHQSLNYQNGFPDFDEFYDIIKTLQKGIISNISL